VLFLKDQGSAWPAEKLEDDVPEATKKRRLAKLLRYNVKVAIIEPNNNVGKCERGFKIEGPSKKSDANWNGTKLSKMRCVVFPKDLCYR